MQPIELILKLFVKPTASNSLQTGLREIPTIKTNLLKSCQRYKRLVKIVLHWKYNLIAISRNLDRLLKVKKMFVYNALLSITLEF